MKNKTLREEYDKVLAKHQTWSDSAKNDIYNFIEKVIKRKCPQHITTQCSKCGTYITIDL